MRDNSQMPEMFDYQKDAVEYLENANMRGDNVLLEWPTGTGKTRPIIEYIKKIMVERKRVIIIVPTRFAVGNVWREELKKWDVDTTKFVSMTGEINKNIRRRYWEIIENNKFNVIITPISLNNDCARGWVNLTNFQHIHLDEAHHSVTRDFDDGWRRNYNYDFLTDIDKDAFVTGTTIKSNDNRIKVAEKELNAQPLIDKRAKTQRVITKIIEIGSKPQQDCDELISKYLGFLSNQIKNICGIGIDQPFKFFNISGNIEKVRKEKGLNKEQVNKLKFLSCKVNELEMIRTCLIEDMLKEMRNWLKLFLQRNNSNLRYKRALEKIYTVSQKCKEEKTYHIIKKVEEKLSENKSILITTKRRRKAREIHHILNNIRGVKTGILMGGLQNPQFVLDNYLKEGCKVVVMTPVGVESVNLNQFKVLINISPYSSKFTRTQLKGRIRGGEQFYFIYKETSEENKLKQNVDNIDFAYLNLINELQKEIRLKIIYKKDSQKINNVYNLYNIIKNPKNEEKNYSEEYLKVPTRYSSIPEILANHNLVGKFGEEIAIAYLNQKNFQTFFILDYIRNTNLKREERKFLESIRPRLIDYLCMKDDIKYLVEIKTQGSTVFREQKEKLDQALKLGYGVIVFNIQISKDHIEINRRIQKCQT